MADNPPISPELQQTIQSLDASITTISKHVESFLSAPMEDLISQMTSEEHAKLNVLLAYTLNTLFYAYLKTQGASPGNHPVKAELERVKTYLAKLKELSNQPKETPTVALNKEAAERFIKHALVEISDEPKSGKSEANEQEEKKRKKKNKKSPKKKTKSKEVVNSKQEDEKSKTTQEQAKKMKKLKSPKKKVKNK
jgi:exosome complex protein LRP1